VTDTDELLRLEYEYASRLLGTSAGVIPASHRLGVGLGYGAALGGWVYLVVWGALVAAGARAHSQAIGVAVGAVVALAIVREVGVAQGPGAKPAATNAAAPSR
jgi:hypothetical protein